MTTNKPVVAEPKNYQIVDDDDNVLEDDLTLFEAEIALTRCCNEGVDAYLVESGHDQ